MSHTIHVVVTCTQSKRGRVEEPLRARSLPSTGRLEEWARRLESVESEALPARDVYRGGHWSVALDLERVSVRRATVHVWVVSAGYGLLALDDLIKPYAATFQGRHEDSVGSTEAEVQAWWKGLSAWDHQAKGVRPRTLAGLVAEDPNASLLVVASLPYLRALEGDLAGAVEESAKEDRILVVSAGGRRVGGRTQELVLNIDARVQEHLGGAMQSLNVRIAREILQTSSGGPLSRAAIEKQFQELQGPLAAFSYPERTKLSDEDVLDFILQARKARAKTSASALLRDLRSSGRACEQSRFSKLYKSTSGMNHA